MWAHYADNHRGVCLQFQFASMAKGSEVLALDSNFTGHYSIRYSGDFAQVAEINDIGAVIQLLHTKHPDWSYEQEVRFIKFGDINYPGVGGTVCFQKRSLSAVVLGCKVPKRLHAAVAVLLDEFGYERTELVTGEFDHRTQRLAYKRLRAARQTSLPASESS
jgi:hypothetical protein